MNPATNLNDSKVLFLDRNKLGSPDIQVLPEPYKSKECPENLIDVVILGSAFCGIEMKRQERNNFLFQCGAKKGYMYDFAVRALTLMRKLLLINGPNWYKFIVPEEASDVRLVAISWNPTQPNTVDALVVETAMCQAAVTGIAESTAQLLPITTEAAVATTTTSSMAKARTILPTLSVAPVNSVCRQSVTSTTQSLQPIVSVAPNVMNTAARPRTTPSVATCTIDDDVQIVEVVQTSKEPTMKKRSRVTPSIMGAQTENKKPKRLSRKRKADCSQVSQTKSKKSEETVCATDNNDDPDALLEGAERAIKKSEAITNAYLGQELSRVVDRCISNSPRQTSSLGGSGGFSVEQFVNTMLSNLSEEDKEKISAELAKSNQSAPAQGQKESAANYPTIRQALGLAGKPVPTATPAKPSLANLKIFTPRFNGNGSKAKQDATMNTGRQILTANRKVCPLPAHNNPVKAACYEVQKSALDLSRVSRTPVYVDGANDSISSGTHSSTISSSLLHTPPTPRQPQSPPMYVSSDTGESTPRQQSSSSVDCANSVPHDDDGNSEEISDVSDFSTLTTSSHGTFATDASSHGNSLNGINLESMMNSEEDPIITSSQNIGSGQERAVVTLDDILHDENYDKFKAKLLKCSSPKAAPTNVKRKHILLDLNVSGLSSTQSSQPSSQDQKRQKCCLLFGPVNNPMHPNGWIKTRCTEADLDNSILPDLHEDDQEKRTVQPNSKDPLWGGRSQDEVSQDALTFVSDECDVLQPMTDNYRPAPRSGSGSGKEDGKRVTFDNDMDIPTLLKTSMQYLSKEGFLSCYLRRMVQNPFVDDVVPDLNVDAAIIVEHYAPVIDKEIRTFLEVNNVNIQPLHETRVLRFQRKICNAIVNVIPRRFLEFDHFQRTVKKLSQTDVGDWDNYSFKCFMEMLNRLKLQAIHPVVDPSAFWVFFSDELKRVGVRRSPDSCEKMEASILERYHAIKNDNRRSGRDKVIYDTLSVCAHLNPPSLGSSAARKTKKDTTKTAASTNWERPRDSMGRFVKKDGSSLSQGPQANDDVFNTDDRIPSVSRSLQYAGHPTPTVQEINQGSASALYPDLPNYAQTAKGKNANVANSLGDIAQNSKEITSAVVTMSEAFTTYMQNKSSSENNGRSPYINYQANYPPRSSTVTREKDVWSNYQVPPSPEIRFHVCKASCPIPCPIVYET